MLHLCINSLFWLKYLSRVIGFGSSHRAWQLARMDRICSQTWNQRAEKTAAAVWFPWKSTVGLLAIGGCSGKLLKVLLSLDHGTSVRALRCGTSVRVELVKDGVAWHPFQATNFHFKKVLRHLRALGLEGFGAAGFDTPVFPNLKPSHPQGLNILGFEISRV